MRRAGPSHILPQWAWSHCFSSSMECLSKCGVKRVWGDMAFPREAKAGRWVPSVWIQWVARRVWRVWGAAKKAISKTQVKPHNFGATLWSEDGPWPAYLSASWTAAQPDLSSECYFFSSRHKYTGTMFLRTFWGCSELQLVRSLQCIVFWTFRLRYINNLALKWTHVKWWRIKSITNAPKIFMETAFLLKDCIYRVIYALIPEIPAYKRRQGRDQAPQLCFPYGKTGHASAFWSHS